MKNCKDCKFLFTDESVGYWECLRTDDFSDEEFETYEKNGHLKNCPFFEEKIEVF